VAVEPCNRATSADLITALTTAAVQDPFPIYEQLRELDHGVHWAEELGGWVCTRYDDVKQTFTDTATFSNEYFFDLASAVHEPTFSAHLRYVDISSKQFMLTDPPAHTEVRSILRGAFTPRAVQRWEVVVQDVTETLLDSLLPDAAVAELDVMEDLAAEVPVSVIAAMLGIPPEDTWRFRRWTEAFVDTFNPRITSERRSRSIDVAVDMFDYLTSLVERKRDRPVDDLTTLLATAELEDGSRLDNTRIVAQLALLLAAGNETTMNLIGNGITLLIEHPEVQQALRARIELLPAAIEEMLRLDPPLHFDLRKATKETTLGGQRIEAGQLCYQLIASANRDARRFRNPHAFSLDRGKNSHFAFSHGIHFCLGAQLARMEAEIVFRKLLERYPHFTNGKEPAVRKTEEIISRGWRTRPIRLIRAVEPE
jgi:cytochrome P450